MWTAPWHWARGRLEKPGRFTTAAETQATKVEAMIRLEKVPKPHLQAVAAALKLT